MQHVRVNRRSLLRLAAAGAGTLALPWTTRVVQAADVSIVRPRLVNPEFVEPGGSFAIEVRGDRNLSTSGWSATLRNDLSVDWRCAVEDVEWSNINADREDGWRLRVRTPHDVAPELMQLVVQHRDGGLASASQAVSVVADLGAPFYVLHITDEHVCYSSPSEHDDPALRRAGHRTPQLVAWGAPVINVINPRIAVKGGDQTHRFWSHGGPNNHGAGLIDMYRDATRHYRAPFMAVVGNHDVNEHNPAQQWREWEARMGMRYYVIDMGSLLIFGHDYTDPAARQWITSAYNASWGRNDVRGRLFVQHFTDWHAVDLPNNRPATAMLIGHLHRNEVRDRWPTPILMSAAAHSYVRSTMLSFRRDGLGNWQTDADRWSGGSYFALVGDNGAPNVSTSFAASNNGTASSNQTTITNRLGQSFPDGRIRFLMDGGSYNVRGGEILAQYRYGGGSTAVLVRVPIAGNAKTTISITRTGSSPQPPQPPQPTPMPPGGNPQPIGVWQVTVSADAQVEQDNPTMMHGKGKLLTVDGQPRFQSYLKFQVPQYQGRIARVRLHLYSPAGGGTKPTICRTENNWSEDTLTWIDPPALQGRPLTLNGGISTGAWNVLDITGLVTGPGTLSLALTLNVFDAAVFASRESGNAPYLEIETT